MTVKRLDHTGVVASDLEAAIAMLRAPDGGGRVELSTFKASADALDPPNAPIDTPGIPRLTFVVGDVHDTFDRLRSHGAEPVGEVARYEDFCLYAYIRGPEGIIIGLVEELR